MEYTTEFEFEGITIIMYATLHAYGSCYIYTGEEGYTEMEQYEDPIFKELYYYDEDSACHSPSPKMEEVVIELLESAYWQQTADFNGVDGEY